MVYLIVSGPIYTGSIAAAVPHKYCRAIVSQRIAKHRDQELVTNKHSFADMGDMRALFQNEYGDISSYILGTQPCPVVGEGEVIIKVFAAGLNPIDTKRGLFVKDIDSFPITIGYDVAGVVHQVGTGDVANLAIGDRVFGDLLEKTLGPKSAGSVAEYALCPARLLAKIPEGIDFVKCAALPIAAGSAIQALTTANAQSGHNVFISGGAGGVGLHAMQIAKAKFGAAQVATTASAGKFEIVQRYGADRVVNYKTEDAGEVLKGWADVVFDCTGETDMAKRVVKPGGSIVSIAAFGIEGVTSVLIEPTAEMMKELGDMLASDKLVPVIDTVYEMDDAVAAVKHVAGGRSTGKVVIQVQRSVEK